MTSSPTVADVTGGLEKAAAHGVLQAVGMEEDFTKPQIGIGSSWRSGAGVQLEMGGHGVREGLLTPKGVRHGQVMHTVMRAGGRSGGAYRLDATTIFV